MFDRIVLINLDRRLDRLGAFKAKIAHVPAFAGYTRYRAVEGDKVTVPHFFMSGGGAYGCRQSHLRVLEDALMDDLSTLLVLEDDVCFCPDFQQKLHRFMSAVPNDWHGLMLGGQNQVPPTPTSVPGILRAVDTQRTHAYAVRGKEAIRSLYRLWARSDRHIDHLFGYWQQEHNVYQPDPFLCGQDEGKSDITGRDSSPRFWFARGGAEVPDLPLYHVVCPRAVAEQLRLLGFHFGYHREPITGNDKGLQNLEKSSWPNEQFKEWADTIVYEAATRGDVPGIWYASALPGDLEHRTGRKIVTVGAPTVEEAVRAIPELLPRYTASQVVWCWQGEGADIMYGLDYFGWHAGYNRDPVTGLNNSIRQWIERDRTDLFRAILRDLTLEATRIRYGKVLLAHPRLDIDYVRDNLIGTNVKELVGTTVKDIVDSYDTTMAKLMENL